MTKETYDLKRTVRVQRTGIRITRPTLLVDTKIVADFSSFLELSSLPSDITPFRFSLSELAIRLRSSVERNWFSDQV